MESHGILADALTRAVFLCGDNSIDAWGRAFDLLDGVSAAWVGGFRGDGPAIQTLYQRGDADRDIPEWLPDKLAAELRRWVGESAQPRIAECRGSEWANLRELVLRERSGLAVILGLSEGRTPVGVIAAVLSGGVDAAVFRQQLNGVLWALTLAVRSATRFAALQAEADSRAAERSALLTKLGRDNLNDAVVGDEAGLKSVMQRVELVRKSAAPVMLFGETGSGKEVIARAIHQGSPRRDRPFVRVNCGAIPPDLIDSQLFGHEKGSFTGAVERRAGWFERANHGTLFLDEIGELSPAAQVRLLRVLQDGSLERVGGHETIHVDCRIIGATHRDLPSLVQEGRFREDLWYRLAVFPIVIPPLRERLDDLPALARHFAHRAAIRFGLTECKPTDADLTLLAAYRWPGNVRELAAVIDRAAILGDGRALDVAASLGVGVARGTARGEKKTRPEPNSDAVADTGGAGGEPFESLNDVQRRHIRAALERCRGRVDGPDGAAALLKINPHTLRARMRKLGVDWRAFRIRRS